METKPTQQIMASQVKDRAFLRERVCNGKAYQFLKNVRGSPSHYQRTLPHGSLH